MRIVVLGATGNVGTAVLHRLQAADEVSSIVGVSRRGPDRAGAPYDGVEWHRLDVAEPTAAGRLREIVDPVLFLLSDAASAVTGQTLTVDCGEFHT